MHQVNKEVELKIKMNAEIKLTMNATFFIFVNIVGSRFNVSRIIVHIIASVHAGFSLVQIMNIQKRELGHFNLGGK